MKNCKKIERKKNSYFIFYLNLKMQNLKTIKSTKKIKIQISRQEQ